MNRSCRPTSRLIPSVGRIVAILLVLGALRADVEATPRRRRSARTAQRPPSPPGAKRSPLLKPLILALARRRGFRLRRHLVLRSYQDADLRAYRARRLETLLGPRDHLAIDAAIAARLGLLPPGHSYEDTLRRALGGPVAAFFDAKRGILFVAPALASRLAPPLKTHRGALVHEICRALQAQNLPIARFSRPFPRNSDRVLARRALIAGDCAGVMLEDALHPTGASLSNATVAAQQLLRRDPLRHARALRDTPLFWRRLLLFPHEAGLAMVQTIRQRFGWRHVTARYRRPPETTEQVLHPGKRGRRAHPRRVRATSLRALKAWRRVKVDTLGELQLSAILETHLDHTLAARAAAGWGGDRLVAYLPAPQDPEAHTPPLSGRPRHLQQSHRRPHRRPRAQRRSRRALKALPTPRTPGPLSPPLLIHLSVWDSEADAIEQEDAQRRWLRARFGPSRPTQRGAHIYTLRGGAEEASTQRSHRAVLLILGAPPNERAALQVEVWTRWRVNGRHLRAPRRAQ